jgi:uncharacterized protein with PhoU and TrkA domain
MHMVDKLSSVMTKTAEVLICPGGQMKGQRLGDLRLRRRNGVHVLAAHRRNQKIGRQLDDMVLRVGDTPLREAVSRRSSVLLPACALTPVIRGS